MNEVDILAEIRACRDARAAAFNYDIAAMVRDLQSREKLSGRVLLQPPPKPGLDPAPDLDALAAEILPPPAKAG
ncbi:MAG: hypothetical protein K2X87_19805 [Gemmataceae bacterium]|nr:hypothetical protein [Gemmataceae bacterium]